MMTYDQWKQSPSDDDTPRCEWCGERGSRPGPCSPDCAQSLEEAEAHEAYEQEMQVLLAEMDLLGRTE